MAKYKRLRGWRKLVVVSTLGTTFAFPWGLLGGCDLGEFTTSSTVTLSGREVASFLVRSAILTPIENAINLGVDWLFDRIDKNDAED